MKAYQFSRIKIKKGFRQLQDLKYTILDACQK